MAASDDAANPNRYATLEAFLKKHRCYVRGGTGGTAPSHPREQWTHLMMNGGKLAVPADLYPCFLTLYARDVAGHARHYYHEELTRVFRLMVDLDLELTRDELPDADAIVARIMSLIQLDVASFYEDDEEEILRRDLSVTVCTTDVKELRDGEAFKVGVHGYWWGVFDTSDMALEKREAMLARLRRELGERPPGVKTWEDVVDAGIYRRGMRMVGSHKASACTLCRRERRFDPNCTQCHNGYVLEARPYVVAYVMRPDGTIDQEATGRMRDMSSDLWAHQTTLRTNLAAPSPACCRRPPSAPPSTLAKEARRRTAAQRSSGKSSAGATSRFTPDATLPPDTPASRALEVFLQQAMGEHYRHVYVKSVAVIEEPKGRLAATGSKRKRSTLQLRLDGGTPTRVYIVIVGGAGSGYCQNARRSHRSRSIYFYVSARGAEQRCFCECADTADRVQGKRCKDYKSEPAVPLTQDLLLTLYPELAPPPPPPPRLAAAAPAVQNRQAKNSNPRQSVDDACNDARVDFALLAKLDRMIAATGSSGKKR